MGRGVKILITVSSARCYIDDVSLILCSDDNGIKWCKLVPMKVNILHALGEVGG